ncbi:MAG: hypothetical protein WAU70_15050 [Flavobacteriales bacterium]
MKLTKTLAALSLLLIGTGASAQMYGSAVRTTLTEGDLSVLKGEKEVKLEFSYEGMMVGGFTDEAYQNKKQKEYNEKEAGKGDTWKENWVGNREKLFHPKFTELFNDRLDGALVGGMDKTSAKYTFIVRTTSTEPGYNIGISRVPASLNSAITLVETADHSKVLAEMVVANCPGANAMGFDYDAGGRIAEGYAKMGKELAAFLQKKVPIKK